MLHVRYISLPNDNVEFLNLRFQRQSEPTKIHFSFPISISKALLPVNLQRAP